MEINWKELYEAAKEVERKRIGFASVSIVFPSKMHHFMDEQMMDLFFPSPRFRTSSESEDRVGKGAKWRGRRGNLLKRREGIGEEK